MHMRSRASRLLISVWNKHHPRQFSCSNVILTQRICFRYGVQRGVWLWNTDFGNWKSTALYDCSLKEYSDKGMKDILWGEVGEAVVSEWSQLGGRQKCQKCKQSCFSIYLIQMHICILICCKIKRCLTSQRKLTLAESYDFLVVVKKGQYFFRVYQIPNHTLLYCQGTAPCGDVKYLAK
jgi:hypothetical protein